MSNTYLDRQEDELLFLKEVFREDIEDLREKDPWKVWTLYNGFIMGLWLLRKCFYCVSNYRLKAQLNF